MALKRYNGTAWVVITAADIGAEPAFSKNTAFNKNFGTGAGTVCEGNDTRLSDARTPTVHNQAAETITTGILAIDRLPTVTVEKGGTGATDAKTARTNLVAQRAIIACETPTAAATVEKIVTNTGVALEPFSLIMITFTLGNRASDMTINYNNTGAKPVRLAGGAPTGAYGIGASYCVPGNKIAFIYDGEYFWQQGSQDITDATFSTITQAEIDAGTSTSTRAVTPKLLVDNFAKIVSVLKDYTYADVSSITTTDIADRAMLFCTEAEFASFQSSNPTIANAVKLVFMT